MALTLIVGNKNYSSWSLRPWLALTAAGVEFDEKLLPIGTNLFRETLHALGTAGRVPVLLDDDTVVWDSLAIIEHVAERYPDRHLWPTGHRARGFARAISAEMHAGFHYLRRQLPMNLWRPVEALTPDEGAAKDIARIVEIWRTARANFGANGEFLFGRFSAADAMYAPVATRLATYDVPLDPVCAAYVAAIHAHPAFVAWKAAALQEEWVLAEDEVDWPQVKRTEMPRVEVIQGEVTRFESEPGTAPAR